MYWPHYTNGYITAIKMNDDTIFFVIYESVCAYALVLSCFCLYAINSYTEICRDIDDK